MVARSHPAPIPSRSAPGPAATLLGGCGGRWVALLLVAACLTIDPHSACFVRNCPVGGKRAAVFFNSIASKATRQCRMCDAKGRGVCLGPDTCCTRERLCESGTAASAECVLENFVPTPCSLTGRACGLWDPRGPDNGVCALEGLCCSLDLQTCLRNTECEKMSSASLDQFEH